MIILAIYRQIDTYLQYINLSACREVGIIKGKTRDRRDGMEKRHTQRSCKEKTHSNCESKAACDRCGIRCIDSEYGGEISALGMGGCSGR